MKLNIEASEKMCNEYLCKFDNKCIRIPKHVRQMYGIELGCFINFKGKNNTVIPLQVYKATNNDYDNHTCKVSTTTFDLLDIDTEVVNGVTIGCDPELFIVDKDGKCISAYKYFPKNDIIGYDGSMLEIRPQYTMDCSVLTKHIKGLLKKAKEVIEKKEGIGNTRMIGASYYSTYSAGFHIHLGLPQSMLQDYERNIKTINEIVQTLDYFVGMLGILSDTEYDAKRRSSPYVVYGKPGNYRIDRTTLEYRVPGGSLLKSPYLTNGILSIGALVIEDIINNVKRNFTDFRKIYNIPCPQDVIDSICSEKKNNAMHHLDTIYKKLTNMYGFVHKKEEIDRYFDSINNDDIINNNCIDVNWRLTG